MIASCADESAAFAALPWARRAIKPDLVIRAVGGRAYVVAVLLTASEPTVRERLAGREIGSELAAHVERSLRMAKVLADQAPAGTHVIDTDHRTVPELAAQVVHLTGWPGAGRAPFGPD